MKFVTKEEFEKAITTVKLALKNGQVKYGHHDNQEEMSLLLIGDADKLVIVDANHTTFISPFMSAQAHLLKIRAQLNQFRQENEEKVKELESLEKKEKELADIVAALKE
jgi:hypothetical protein